MFENVVGHKVLGESETVRAAVVTAGFIKENRVGNENQNAKVRCQNL